MKGSHDDGGRGGGEEGRDRDEEAGEARRERGAILRCAIQSS